MGWAEKLASGRYRAGYRVPGGEKRYIESSFTHKAAAERAASAAEQDARALGWRDPRAAERSWGDWCAEWLRGHYVERSTHSRTMSMIESRIMPKWGDTRLIDINRHEIRAWAIELQQAGLTATSAKRIIAAFSPSLSAAVDVGILKSNPAIGLRLNIPTNLSERVLSVKEQRHLFAGFAAEGAKPSAEAVALAARDQALVAVLLGAGPRWGEAVALMPEHVNRKQHTIRWRQAWDAHNRILAPYTKGKKRRTTPIAPWLMEIIEPLLDATERGHFIFTDVGGAPLDASNWRKRNWDPAVKRSRINDGAGERATIHTLRHTYATEQLEAGLSLAEIADLLGHASITTTERYAHRRSRVRAEAATAVKDPRLKPSKPKKKRKKDAAEEAALPANVIQFPSAG